MIVICLVLVVIDPMTVMLRKGGRSDFIAGYCRVELQPELGNPNWASTGSIRIVNSDKNKFDNAVSADRRNSSSDVCNSNYSS